MSFEFQRASGILLHPTSLPGKYGIGDLGSQAEAFVDFLLQARQTYWQILPLGPTGYGDSPYQCFSAFAGNTLLISPEKLVEAGLIEQSDLDAAPQFPDDRVDYGGVYNWKNQLLPRAYAGYSRSGHDKLGRRFSTFCSENGFWLEDYALYRSVKAAQDQKPWYEWPKEVRRREPDALERVRAELAGEIEAQKFYQFLFFDQWAAIKGYANSKGVLLVGDIPIFVALDSADVWCNQDKFKLNADGSPRVVAGVPPDYFSSTGQLWGNPIYDWEAMQQDGFRWWAARVNTTLQTVDIARIDHFRGFAAAWEVPGKDKTAEKGTWVNVPGNELFAALRSSLGDLPLIAEDLGVITPDVTELRDAFGFPGMRILQYGFGGDAGNYDLPHNYISHCVAYTGTHDNDTAVGWFRSLKDERLAGGGKRVNPVRDHCLNYLASDGKEINWDLIRALWASVADTAIIPAQDLFGLGNEARMNRPATSGGNWQWRLSGDTLTEQLIARLKELTEIYGRVSTRQ